MDRFLADKVTLSVLAAVSFAMLAWDYCVLLSVEYQVYLTLKKAWRDPRPWMFILLRYTGVAALLANMVMSSVAHQHCQLAAGFSYTFQVLLIISFCALVTLRVSTIWEYHPDVVCGMGFLTLGVTGLWIGAATRISPFLQSDVPPGLSKCGLHPFPSWFSATYAAFLIFNLVAFSLAATKFFAKPQRAERDVGREFKLLTFLILSAAAAAALLVITALGPEQQSNKQAAAGFFIFLVATMGTRIYLTFGTAELQVQVPIFAPTSKPPSRSNSVSYPSWTHASSSINQPGMNFSAISSSRNATTVANTETIEVQVPLVGPTLRPPSPVRNRPISTESSSRPLASPNGGEDFGPDKNTELQQRTPVPPNTRIPNTSALTNASNPPVPQQVQPLPPISASTRQVGTRPPNEPSSSKVLPSPKISNKKQKRVSSLKSGWIDS